MTIARTLTVLSAGAQSLVQDRGRPGLAGQGVGPSGAADRRSHDLANRLLGNDPGAATIETVLGGLQVRADGDLTVVVTGAAAPVLLDGAPMGHNAPLRMAAGSVLALGHPPTGLRSYLGVRGGVDVTPVLGSRATDLLSGLGPPLLIEGSILGIGSVVGPLSVVDQAAVWSPCAGPVVLRARRGPRGDWFHDMPFGREWRVSSRSDRIGVRLDGEPMHLIEDRGELPSEGVVRGALQVPPSGEPVLFLADHPVTGGYPVVVVVLDADVDLAAQARPGQTIVFREDI